MDAISRLSEYFESFPGIGPRQAKRFVYFLVTRDTRFLKEFARALEALTEARAICDSCCRYFTKGASGKSGSLCALCHNPNRSSALLMIVAKEVDADNVERSGTYDGRYFILGSHLSLVEKNKDRHRERLEKLAIVVDRQGEDGLKEVVLAFAVNPEGEQTAYHIREILRPIAQKREFKITTLGRGLSTGIELEYPDPETIKNALQNRR